MLTGVDLVWKQKAYSQTTISVINAYELRIPSEILPTQIGIFRELLRGSSRLRHVQNELFRNSMDDVIQ